MPEDFTVSARMGGWMGCELTLVSAHGQNLSLNITLKDRVRDLEYNESAAMECTHKYYIHCSKRI